MGLVRSKLFHAYHLSLQTTMDVDKIIRKVRDAMKPRDAIETRRLLLALSAHLSIALKNLDQSEGELTSHKDALETVEKLSKRLEKMINLPNADQARLRVVVDRLGEIKKAL